MALYEKHQHYEEQTLDLSFRPKWLSAENNNQSSHIQPQIEESNSEGSCPIQRSLHQQDVQEKEAAEDLSHQFYDQVVDYMTTLFCQQQAFMQRYMQSFVSGQLSWYLPIVVFKFQEYGGIRSNTQMLDWCHWKADFTCLSSDMNTYLGFVHK